MMSLKLQFREVMIIIIIMAIIATIMYWGLVICMISFYVDTIKPSFNEETARFKPKPPESR